MQGTLTVCFAHGTDKPVPCNRAGAQFVIVSFLEVGGVTWDGNGNACASGAETISVQGSAVSITQDVNFVGKMTSYDPSTQSGDGSGTGYSGGKCIGASFDNTGATERSNATFHFVISQGGKRLDSVLTSLSAVDQQIGTFSVSGTGFQQ